MTLEQYDKVLRDGSQVDRLLADSLWALQRQLYLARTEPKEVDPRTERTYALVRANGGQFYLGNDRGDVDGVFDEKTTPKDCLRYVSQAQLQRIWEAGVK